MARWTLALTLTAALALAGSACARDAHHHDPDEPGSPPRQQHEPGSPPEHEPGSPPQQQEEPGSPPRREEPGS